MLENSLDKLPQPMDSILSQYGSLHLWYCVDFGFKGLVSFLKLPPSGPRQHNEQGPATLPFQDSPANIEKILMSGCGHGLCSLRGHPELSYSFLTIQKKLFSLSPSFLFCPMTKLYFFSLLSAS